MGRHELVGFRDGLVALGQVNVHLVTIKIGVVRRTISVVESKHLILVQDSSDVTHHRGLVKGRLTVHNQRVTVGQMAVHDLATDLDLVGHAITFFSSHVGQQHLFARVLVFNDVRTWVHI